MGIDFSHANIGQVNAASDNATVNVFNTEKVSKTFLEVNKKKFAKAVEDVEESIEELPVENQEPIKKEIVILKEEVAKTNPDGSKIRTSLSMLDNIVNTISNAPDAVKTIARLIMIVKAFWGL